LPQDDPRQRQPDISKARDVLNWKPTVPLQEGLLATIEYFDGVLSAHKSAPSIQAAQAGT
jgi:UDP-glucuronate decarboxylase